ncbi:MAG: OmpA family protein [Clostridia bacterium]|nr:OmpA family protein [Clostridia bacterium]
MARQQAHNRRAGRGGGGSSWISYSDIMAALVMVFVLFLVYSLYNYGSQIQTQKDELERQQSIVIVKQAENDQLRLSLDAKEKELSAQTIILIGKQEELDNAKATLAAKEADITRLQIDLATLNGQLLEREAVIASQERALREQSEKLNTMVGVRSEIVQELSGALSRNHLSATIDAGGNITLESSVFFEVNSYEIRADGKAMLNQFLPVYLEVLMRPEYRDFLGEIIIEGHTDSSGDYLKNLRLSQNRALAVAEYCLNTVSPVYRQNLQKLLTAKGRANSDPVYYEGTQIENPNASRRVVFKFSLKDAEMVQQMNTILQQTYGPGAMQINDPTLP